MILWILGIGFIGFVLLFVYSWLKTIHQTRFVDGVDIELEHDIEEFQEYLARKKGK